MRATIVITTKNRRDELERTLNSCVEQTARPEILVIDDGSTDGTTTFVKSSYPTIQLVRDEKSQGLIAQRNNAAEIVNSDVIVSIDDDATFSANNIVANVMKQFTDPRVAAIAIPFVNVNTGDPLKQAAPDAQGTWITNEFIGTAYAIRRNVFREVGGFRDVFVHQEEEGDLCIRLLQRGYFVRLGTGAPIHHFQSAQRSFERINFYGQRNLILFAWFNVPFPEVLLHLPVTIFNGLLWGLKQGFFQLRLKGTLIGLSTLFGQLARRAPVSRETYWLYRRLKKRGPITLAS